MCVKSPAEIWDTFQLGSHALRGSDELIGKQLPWYNIWSHQPITSVVVRLPSNCGSRDWIRCEIHLHFDRLWALSLLRQENIRVILWFCKRINIYLVVKKPFCKIVSSPTWKHQQPNVLFTPSTWTKSIPGEGIGVYLKPRSEFAYQINIRCSHHTVQYISSGVLEKRPDKYNRNDLVQIITSC